MEGRGRPAEPGRSLGHLSGLQEKAEVGGGVMSMESAPSDDTGFCLVLCICKNEAVSSLFFLNRKAIFYDFPTRTRTHHICMVGRH